MQRKRGLMILMMATIVLSMYITPAMAVTNISNIWTSPQIDGSFSRDYYKRVTSTGLPDAYYNRHIGSVDVNYKVKYIANDDSSYDYYSIAIVQTVIPACAMSGDDFDYARITRGIVYFRLQDSNQIVKDILPGYGGVTGTCMYGIGARVGNSDADFTTTGSLSVPNVYIAGYKSSLYGSTNNWAKFVTDSDSREDGNIYRWTALIKVREGCEINVKLEFKTYWQTTSVFPGFPLYPSYVESTTVRFDGTPAPPPSGGGGGFIFV
ncbi:MAG: hypothetical protein ACTSV2_19790 [Candidatus Thorarchaeota archaeon]